MRSKMQKKADLRYKQSEKGRATKKRSDQSEKDKARNHRYRQTEKGKAAHARGHVHYRQNEKGKIANARVRARRKELGFEMINDWFPGCDGHHIDKENVLFIPSKLHNSIRHQQNDSASMKEINNIAYEWLCTQEIL